MKKEYISPKARVIEIESDSILAGSLLDDADTQNIELDTEEVLDTNNPNFVVW